MTNYIGEHTWAGILGHTLTSISFVMALLAAVAYFLAVQRKNGDWANLGRLAFRVHSTAVIGVWPSCS